MTAQISDSFLLEDRTTCLVASSGDFFFHPMSLGIRPHFASTACMDGYHCTYGLEQGQLVVKELSVSTLREVPPPIGDIDPKKSDSVMFDYVYEGLRLPMAFTGKLLLGDDFLPSYYVHMGYQSFWSYSRLFELSFTDGELTGYKDCSNVAEKVRRYLKSNDLCFLDSKDRKALQKAGIPLWW